MLREACETAGSQKAWAAANGVSTAYVSDVLAGRRDPGEGIAKAFGLKPITVYVPLTPPEQQATHRALRKRQD